MLSVLLLSHLFTAAFAAQPSAPAPVEAPLRELPWGQLNFLQTTDVHGWFAGHLQEPSYSADWGDYISFAKHLRDRADADGKDLLLIDTGDRIEGNGLTDASDPKAIYTYDIVKEQDIDFICSGNHELYKTSSSEGELNFTVPNFKDKYLASNLDIFNPKTGNFEPLARRYKKLTTKNQGIRVLVFGFLYDFTGNSNNTIVHTVEDTIKQDWFQYAIRDEEVDLILVAGHVAIRSKEYDAIYKAIRSVQYDTPLQFFGGHTHIRDFKRYDDKTTALESGRYMETIGFLSISGLNGHSKSEDVSASKGLTFSRRYIDNNLFSLRHHSGTDQDTFTTSAGSKTSALIHEARKNLTLDTRYGCAPQDYWVNRAPYPSVLPGQFKQSHRAAKGHPALVITNTGAMRFDVFKGPFTRDTTFLISPFTSQFSYLRDVPYKKAKKLLQLLNNEGPIVVDKALSASVSGSLHRLMPELPEIESGDDDNDKTIVVTPLRKHKPYGQVPLGDKKPELIPGYTTKDDAGDDGDDTLHSEIKFYNVPPCIQASIGLGDSDSETLTDKEPQAVDVVYNEFLESWILLALEYLDEKRSKDDIALYMNGTLTDIITGWVSDNWAHDGDDCP
ncbi:hypothetical protein EJ05DRAFT_530853 [Pseudovirgaria hyperparasitica]|uniref:Uncharacterized protein n=1 Tax=Pseudovirgaria hyperparasitica TaxID=470096 RepID=A0A6A6WF10_9PEZI|nr:uncharacterized protein EJ05DRAFT_530853 [Pseudovirgaria hyperparasitica]KAF2761408.1 hypothetical protein EJ05DRAFT_530853 [Pseudovirgaria hyperparasitica]